jgi:nitrogen regulatory protein PII
LAIQENLDFITIIVQRKEEKKVIDAALKAGAPGVTFLHGHGTGARQRLGLTGQMIEAEKAVILLAVPPSVSAAVINAVTAAASLNKPGNGFVCVQKAQQVIGFL